MWIGRICRIIAALALMIAFEFSGLFMAGTQIAYAEDTAGVDLTVTASPPGAPLAPSGFSLTDQGAITVTANWTLEGGGPYVMIRAARDEYPTAITDGELLYYGPGDSANVTGFSLETTKYWASIWGYASDNVVYSALYDTAYIGGEGMAEVADELASFNAILDAIFPVDANTMLTGIIVLVLVLALTALAFWKDETFIYLMAAPVNLIYGLSLAATATDTATWVLGSIVAVIGTFCLFKIVARELMPIIRRRRE